MLDINGLFVVGGSLFTTAGLWALILIVRPALARQRLELRTSALRDRLVDARRRGKLEGDDAELDALLQYCDAVIDGVVRFTFFETRILKRTLEANGVTFVRGPAKEPQSTIERAERQLDRMVWSFIISGSKLWFVLEPARYLRRLLRKSHQPAAHAYPMPLPSEIATDLREVAEGDRGPVARSAVLQDLPTRSQAQDDRRILVGAP